MAKTIIGLNDAKAVKRYSGLLAVDVARTSYFGRKFMGEGPESSMPIQRLTELENDAGEYISFDLSMQLKMQPVEGDDVLEGKEEALQFYTDGVYIDQMRGGVNTGGKMTRKRTLHDLRRVAKKRQTEWWARVFDELFFMYLSGSRGINTEYIYPTSYTGFANNSITSPDSDHIIYADGLAKATILVTSVMDLKEIDRAVAISAMMGGGTQETPQIQPILINNETHYVCVMNPWQVYDVRTSTSTGQWMDIQKAAASAEGKNNPIFKGGLGFYNDVVLHEHKAIIRFSDYGVGVNLGAARALFLGVQAAVLGFGSPGSGLRFDWHEESRDNGNQAVITTSTICGVKKVTFNGKDFGVMCIDTAARQPTGA